MNVFNKKVDSDWPRGLNSGWFFSCLLLFLVIQVSLTGCADIFRDVESVPPPSSEASTETLVKQQSEGLSLTLWEDKVFWGTGSETWQYDETDGAVRLADEQRAVANLLVEEGRLYWVNFNGTTVRSLKLENAGATPQIVADNQSGPRGLAAYDRALYWTNSTGGTVMIAPLDGSAALSQLVEGQAAPRAVEVTGTGIYWMNTETANGGIYRLVVGEEIQELAAETNARPVAMLVDDTHVWWLTNDPGMLRRVGNTGANAQAPETVVDGLNQPVDLAADDTHIYWTDAAAGTISRIDINARHDPELVVAGEARPWALDVDDTHLYWTTRQGGEVRRTVK